MSLPETLPLLTDGVIRLREFSNEDASMVAEATTDPLIPLITSVPTQPDPAELLAYVERQRQRLRDRWG